MAGTTVQSNTANTSNSQSTEVEGSLKLPSTPDEKINEQQKHLRSLQEQLLAKGKEQQEIRSSYQAMLSSAKELWSEQGFGRTEAARQYQAAQKLVKEAGRKHESYLVFGKSTSFDETVSLVRQSAEQRGERIDERFITLARYWSGNKEDAASYTAADVRARQITSEQAALGRDIKENALYLAGLCQDNADQKFSGMDQTALSTKNQELERSIAGLQRATYRQVSYSPSHTRTRSSLQSGTSLESLQAEQAALAKEQQRREVAGEALAAYHKPSKLIVVKPFTTTTIVQANPLRPTSAEGTQQPQVDYHYPPAALIIGQPATPAPAELPEQPKPDFSRYGGRASAPPTLAALQQRYPHLRSREQIADYRRAMTETLHDLEKQATARNISDKQLFTEVNRLAGELKRFGDSVIRDYNVASQELRSTAEKRLVHAEGKAVHSELQGMFDDLRIASENTANHREAVEMAISQMEVSYQEQQEAIQKGGQLNLELFQDPRTKAQNLPTLVVKEVNEYRNTLWQGLRDEHQRQRGNRLQSSHTTASRYSQPDPAPHQRLRYSAGHVDSTGYYSPRGDVLGRSRGVYNDVPFRTRVQMAERTYTTKPFSEELQDVRAKARMDLYAGWIARPETGSNLTRRNGLEEQITADSRLSEQQKKQLIDSLNKRYGTAAEHRQRVGDTLMEEVQRKAEAQYRRDVPKFVRDAGEGRPAAIADQRRLPIPTEAGAVFVTLNGKELYFDLRTGQFWGSGAQSLAEQDMHMSLDRERKQVVINFGEGARGKEIKVSFRPGDPGTRIRVP